MSRNISLTLVYGSLKVLHASLEQERKKQTNKQKPLPATEVGFTSEPSGMILLICCITLLQTGNMLYSTKRRLFIQCKPR